MSDTLIIDWEALCKKDASAGFDDLTKLAALPVERRRAAGGWSDHGEQTELGLPPTRLSFSFLAGPPAESEPALPLIAGPWKRAWRRVHEEFSRTPRSVRLALFALPLLAVIYLPAEPETPSPRPVTSPIRAQAASVEAPSPTSRAAPAIPTALTASPPPPRSLPAPAAKGRTLEARAAELLERGQLPQAAALYDQLALEHPERSVFADAARILRSVERERTNTR